MLLPSSSKAAQVLFAQETSWALSHNPDLGRGEQQGASDRPGPCDGAISEMTGYDRLFVDVQAEISGLGVSAMKLRWLQFGTSEL